MLLHSNPGSALLAALSVLALACSTTPSTPGGGARATLVIDEAWSSRPWVESRANQGQVATLSATFELPADRAAGPAELVLDGMRWDAVLTVNSTSLPPVTGGLAPTRIPLEGVLRAGSNTLSLSIRGPKKVDTLLTGTRFDHATLSGPPRIEFLPGPERLSLLAAGLDEDAATAVVQATAGTTVEVTVALDGEVIQHLGSATLEAGQGRTAPVRWKGQRWPEGDQDLVFLWATLKDPGGRTLDRWGLRTGLRTIALDGQDLELNDQPLHLLAARKWNHSLGTTLWNALASGGNALELHGLPPAEQWLARTDELGVYVVDMPRCDGHVHASADRFAALSAELAAQDQGIITARAGHPSLVLWSMEGRVSVFRPMLLRLQADPVPRIIAGLDLPSDAVSPGDDLRRDTRAWWNNEVNMGQGGSNRPTGAEAAARMGEIFAAGAIGTHIPNWGGGGGDRQAALDTWRSIAAAAGVQRPRGTRRAPARVEVTGLRPGQVAWAWAELHPTVGVVADATGSATLELWHEGAATVEVDGRQSAVTLHPGRWVLPDKQESGHHGMDPLASAWSGEVATVAWDRLPTD